MREQSNGNAFTTIALRNSWHKDRTATTAITSYCSAPDRANCSVHDESEADDEAEVKIRHAMTELAEMDDRMLRDLGIHRGEIEDRLRAERADVETKDASVFSNSTAQPGFADRQLSPHRV